MLGNSEDLVLDIMNILCYLLFVLKCFGSANSYWWTIGAVNINDSSPHTLMAAHRFTRGQQLMVRKNNNLLTYVWKGASIAILECKRQFRYERWNCTNYSKTSVFGKILNRACRETSFIYAITAAGVTYSLSEFCAKGVIKDCFCQRGSGAKSKSGNSWTLEGCHDNIKYGYINGKLFTDAKEVSHDFKSVVNLHNNEAGRLAVVDSMMLLCKCHGVSGNCNVKTCRKALPKFDKIGHALKEHYYTASKVEPIQISGKRRITRNNLGPSSEVYLQPTEQDLVYFEESPNFCKENIPEGSLGVSGRYCNASLKAKGVDGCEILCCGGKWKTENLTRNEHCKCILKRCCFITCEKCRVTREYSYCL